MLMVMLSPRELFLASYGISKEECHEIANSLPSSSVMAADGNPSFIDRGGRVLNWRRFSGIRFGKSLHWNEGEETLKLCSGRRR